jgi:proteasome lid subunit RPN8/RPN11
MPPPPYSRLIVPRPLVAAMIAQALAERPHECGGLLAGRILPGGVARVEHRYPLANAAASPREFESDPRQTHEADRDRRRRGLETLAVYHSHPTSGPVPSRRDREWNYSADVVTFLISLASDPPQVRVWWLTADGYREAEWEVDGEEGVTPPEGPTAARTERPGP